MLMSAVFKPALDLVNLSDLIGNNFFILLVVLYPFYECNLAVVSFLQWIFMF